MLRKIRKQLRVLLKLLEEDIGKNQLYYNFLIIDDHNYLFNFDDLDEQFVRFNLNIPEIKSAEVINWAERYLYLWNEKATNEMIIETDENFYFEKEDHSYMINISTGFRVLRILQNGDVRNLYSFPHKYKRQMEEQYITAMKDDLNDSKIIKNFSAYEAALKCKTLINQLYLEYPNNKFEAIIVKDYKDGKFVMDNKITNRDTKVKNIEEFDTKLLKDIFSGNATEVETNYNKILNLLIDNKFVEKNESKLDWVIPISEKGLKEQKSLCNLVYMLYQLGYIRKNITDVAMSKIINNTFQNITISAKTYGTNRKDYHLESYYSKALHFIK